MQYIVAVEGVIVKDDQILITRRGLGEEHLPGILSIPGGKVEGKGNIPSIAEENLHREILEEVGITVAEKMVYLESKLFPIGEDQVADLVFLCYYQAGEPRPVDLDEVQEVMWMTYPKIIASPDIPDFTKQSIKLAAKYLGWID